MQAILAHKTFVFVTVTLWLFIAWSGLHGHACFDGQEPYLSIHMDSLGEHPDHHENEKHLDADVDLNQPALLKLFKVELPVLVITLLLLVVSFKDSLSIIYFYTRHRPPRLIGLQPPLRAPPSFLA